jgi:uncharacterized protein DUF3179
VYSRELDGRVLTLEASGWTYQDVFVLHDRGTGSLWYPYPEIPGLRAIAGPLEGHELPLVEGEQVTWREWLDVHPETLILVSP